MDYFSDDSEDNNIDSYFTPLTIQFTEALAVSAANILYNYKSTNSQYFTEQMNRFFPNYTGNIVISSLTKLFFDLLLPKQEPELYNSNFVTPWTVELYKEEIGLTDLLGPVRTELPIIVVAKDNKQYEHYCSDELVFGILLGVGNAGITLYLRDTFNKPNTNSIALRLQDLDNYFHNNSQEREYTAVFTNQMDHWMSSFNRNVNFRPLYSWNIPSTTKLIFDTPALIQGIITGARWTNKNPKSLIRDITFRNIQVTF